MLTKEEVKEKLKVAGFRFVYDWKDLPRTTYPKHAHQDRVALYTLAGSITMQFDNHSVILSAGDYFEVPAKTDHVAIVGPDGWECVYGEWKWGRPPFLLNHTKSSTYCGLSSSIQIR